MKLISSRLRKFAAVVVVSALAGGSAWLAAPQFASASAVDVAPKTCGYHGVRDIPAGLIGNTVVRHRVYSCFLFQDTDVYSGATLNSSVVGNMATDLNWVACAQKGTANPVTGGGAYTNSYWLLTEANNGKWGWIPETVVSEGANNQVSPGVPMCAASTPKPTRPTVTNTANNTSNCNAITGMKYYEENWSNKSAHTYNAGQWCMYNPYDQTRVVFQADGNMVEYAGTNTGSHILWASYTQYKGATITFMTDGNIAIKDAKGNAVWASEIYNLGNARTTATHNYTFGTVRDSKHFVQMWQRDTTAATGAKIFTETGDGGVNPLL